MCTVRKWRPASDMHIVCKRGVKAETPASGAATPRSGGQSRPVSPPLAVGRRQRLVSCSLSPQGCISSDREAALSSINCPLDSLLPKSHQTSQRPPGTKASRISGAYTTPPHPFASRPIELRFKARGHLHSKRTRSPRNTSLQYKFSA